MNTILRVAVATAIAAAGTTAANALDITAYAGNTNVNVYISGSTAVDTTLLNTAVLGVSPGGLCQAGTIDVYSIGGPTNRLIYCSASGTSGMTAGQPLAIFKESNVGSNNGVGPLIQIAKNGTSTNTGLSFLSPALLVADTAHTECTVSAVASTASLLAYTSHTGCPAADVTNPATTHLVPTGGFADVEAALLRNPDNVTNSQTDVSANLTSQNVFDVVWGVTVTKGLFYALQAAEYGSACSSSDATSCAPSLSKAQIASLYQGGVQSWTQLGLNNTVDNNTYICRRDIQSGTEASIEAYFLGDRCGYQSPLEASSLAMASQDGAFVFTANSGGNMRACLTAFQNGGTITPYNGDFTGDSYAPATFPAGEWAIGLLSTEVTSANLSPDTFRMVAVDGVLPTLANVVNGYYPYWSSNVAYQIKSGKAGAPTSTPLAVWTTLSTRMGDPAPTKATNTAYVGRPWGSGGDLSPAAQFDTGANVTIPATTTSTAASPINAFTKAPTGGLANNCNTPVLHNGGSASALENTPPEATLLGSGKVNQ
jgi:hypothetical protein